MSKKNFPPDKCPHLIGLIMLRRVTYPDTSTLRCYKCHTNWDPEILKKKYGDPCPKCGHPLKYPYEYTWECPVCGFRW